MIPLQYIKTDKNDTKYFADWTCPRCGGAGEAQKWEYTGKTCWGCGGSGKRPKPLIVKEYTPEYEAKLEARRKARTAKRLAENPPPSEEELKRKADEARKWELKGRFGYADNSVEDVYVDKDGVEKRVMVVAPHGDACY